MAACDHCEITIVEMFLANLEPELPRKKIFRRASSMNLIDAHLLIVIRSKFYWPRSYQEQSLKKAFLPGKHEISGRSLSTPAGDIIFEVLVVQDIRVIDLAQRREVREQVNLRETVQVVDCARKVNTSPCCLLKNEINNILGFIG